MHRLQNDSSYPKVPEIRICARLTVFCARLRDFCGRFAVNLGRRILLNICSQSHIVNMCQKSWSMHAPCTQKYQIIQGPPRKHIGAAVRKGKVNTNGWGVGGTRVNYIIFSASYILLQPDVQALESFFGFNPKNGNLIINNSSRLNSYQWYRAVQQKVEGRFNHGVNFFDAFCHQDGVSLFVWTQQLHHTMTSCAQSTFTFLSATLCNALLLESVPAMAFVEHKSLGTACSNSMPGTAGTVQPLDWTFTWNAIYAEQVWSWIHHESRSLALPACKLVLLWGTLRESIFHCLRHVLVSSIC